MLFKIGDLVTRKSYQHDLVFKIIDIDNDIAYLKGVDVRLYADSEITDLVLYEPDKKEKTKEDRDDVRKLQDMFELNRSEYFYLPGKILHIDGDKDYLERCIRFYKEMHLEAYGVNLKEEDMARELPKLLEEYKPDIIVITGHDAFKRQAHDKNKLSNYQNSLQFVEATRTAREYEKSQDKLIIIAGACQSDYEELIKAGSNFASSPKRINIHALDPAIIASAVALSPKNKEIDLISLIEKTHYGSAGIGGIITSGTMYVGYPR